jgi:adenine-specific DNA-methyltransferase
VFDTYSGVGSSLIASLKHGRRAIGCERDAAYASISKERIKDFYLGKLPIRPMDRELYTPQGKVSRVPDEWKNGKVRHVYEFAEGENRGDDLYHVMNDEEV